MNSFLLRKARENELGIVSSFYRDAIGTDGCTWNEYYPDDTIINQDYNNDKLYVYCENETIVGAVSIVEPTELDDLDCWKYETDNYCEIARIVIANSKRGHGLSQKMLVDLFEKLKNERVESIRFLVATSNEAAKKTYQNLGFDFREKYYMYNNYYYACELLL